MKKYRFALEIPVLSRAKRVRKKYVGTLHCSVVTKSFTRRAAILAARRLYKEHPDQLPWMDFNAADVTFMGTYNGKEYIPTLVEEPLGMEPVLAKAAVVPDDGLPAAATVPVTGDTWTCPLCGETTRKDDSAIRHFRSHYDKDDSK